MRRGAAIATVFLLLAACTPPTGPLRMPIDSTTRPSRCATPALRILMLPGAYSRAEDFAREGFLDALAASGVDAEVVLVEAHYGYYGDESIVARLSTDFLADPNAPATWLVGISLGAYGALAVAAERPERIAGVVAIAPYPGTRETQREIVAAGGVTNWARQAASANDDGERRLWRWLAGAPTKPPLYAGLADADRFVDGQRLLVSTLPPAQVDVVPGGHDWPAWRELWARFLARGLLAAAGCAAPEAAR